MSILWTDFETRSTVDLNVVGTWKYASHPTTEVLMLSWAFGDEEPGIWLPHEGPMPQSLWDALGDPFQILGAWYCAFERLIFKFVLGIETDISRWVDPAIMCRYLSIPGKLELAGKVLQLGTLEKDQAGKKLIQMFCEPLTPGGEITLFGVESAFFRDHNTHPREFKQFCDYCIQDVRSERAIYNKIKKFDLPWQEWDLFRLDQGINDRGIGTDSLLLQGASLVAEKEKELLAVKLKEITGLQNPNSGKQMLKWLGERGYPFESLEKPWVKRILNGEGSVTEEAKNALTLRSQLSKSSTAKLDAFRNAVNPDGRIRHLFAFMGASRTSRWAGGGEGAAGVQPQNFVKPSKEVAGKLESALTLLKQGNHAEIAEIFTSPLDVAAAAIRPILHAGEGKKLLIADLNAIESRGAAWVAGCEPLMEVFRNNRDPYLEFAVQLDGSRTYEEMLAEYLAGNKKHRNDAKPGVLGCAYGLGPGKITKDDAGNEIKEGLLAYSEAMGIPLTLEFAIKAVETFRNSYKEIVQFWYDLHRAFADVVEKDAIVNLGPLNLEMRGKVLCIGLPSGRNLHYINPVVEWEDAVSKAGRTYRRACLYYDGIEQKTRQWCRIPTRGAKLFENVVQAICRDFLANGLLECEKRGIDVVGHFHDEILAEVPENGELGVGDLVEAMTVVPVWAEGMLLKAEGFESEYYRKAD